MTQAFQDVRIIDFSQVLAGPVASHQLALLGADVIKIEQPGKGDQIRQMMRNNDYADLGTSPSYLTCNFNKRGICLDLKSPAAKEVIAKLYGTADVILENYKAGVIDRLGFGYDFAKTIKPDVIFCSVSGYGQAGPKAGEAAYDGAIQAASGMMSTNGHIDTGPTRTGYMPVDMSTGITTAFAIASALYRRLQTGEGQHLDVAMMDTALTIQAPKVVAYTLTGEDGTLEGNDSPTRQPTANVFPTSDGFVQITALLDPQVEALFAELGLSEMLDDPRFADKFSRFEHPGEVRTAMCTKLKEDTTKNWAVRLAKARVPSAPIQNYSDVVEEPQLNHRDVFMELPAPAALGGTQKLVGAGFKADADGPTARFPAPELGQHTDEVLGELGFSENDISNFRDQGAI
jgi:crotonobetainyl-CoA:carnitine CoA-transferase CaiB-like acyl-CoA transferase